MTNKKVMRRADMNSLHDIVKYRRRRLPGHMLRLSRDRTANTAMEWGLNVAVEIGEGRLRPGARHLTKITKKLVIPCPERNRWN